MENRYVYAHGNSDQRYAIDEKDTPHNADRGYVTVDIFELRENVWVKTGRGNVRREFLSPVAAGA
jgi:hypothetical protein